MASPQFYQWEQLVRQQDDCHRCLPTATTLAIQSIHLSLKAVFVVAPRADACLHVCIYKAAVTERGFSLCDTLSFFIYLPKMREVREQHLPTATTQAVIISLSRSRVGVKPAWLLAHKATLGSFDRVCLCLNEQ